jgi:hypothetical protein
MKKRLGLRNSYRQPVSGVTWEAHTRHSRLETGGCRERAKTTRKRHYKRCKACGDHCSVDPDTWELRDRCESCFFRKRVWRKVESA